MSENILFVQKIWQAAGPQLCLQVYTPRREHSSLPNKFFLLLDASQKSLGVSVTEEKPKDLQSQGSLCEIARKYLENSSVVDVTKKSESNRFYLHLQKKEGMFQVIIDGSKPPKILVLDPDNTVLVQATSQGFFTKRKTCDESILPTLPGKDASIFAALLASLTSESEVSHAANTSAVEKTSPILPRLRRKMKTLLTAKDRLLHNLPSKDELADLQLQAEIVRSMPHLLQKSPKTHWSAQDLKNFSLENPTGEDLILDWDGEESFSKNSENIFKKLKKRKTAAVTVKEHLQKLSKEIQDLENDIVIAESATAETLEKISTRWLQEKQKHTGEKKDSVRKIYRHFQLEKDWEAFVGKEAKDNDVLTKRAKANDFWLHVSGVPGSHVILPNHKKKLTLEQLPENIVRQAGILAVHFSKAKNHREGEVHFTQRQFLRKTKDLAPGQWLLQKSKSVFIRFSEEELQEIYGREIRT